MTRRERIRDLKEQIAATRKAIAEAVASGVQSASLSSAGNAQSYSRLSLSELRAHLRALERELAATVQGSAIRRTCPDFPVV